MLMQCRNYPKQTSGHASEVSAYFFPVELVKSFTSLRSVNPDSLNKE